MKRMRTEADSILGTYSAKYLFSGTNYYCLSVRPYDALETEDERKKWLYAAIFAQDGEDLRNSSFTLEELEDQWFDPEIAKEPGPNRYPGVRRSSLVWFHTKA